MNYLKYLLKKVSKNKFNYIPFMLFLFLIVLVLFLNANTAKNFDLQTYISQNLQGAQAQMESYKGQLQSTKKDSPMYSALEQDVTSYNKNITSYEKAQSYLEAKNYKKTYASILEVVSMQKSISSNPYSGTPPELLQAIQHDYLMFQSLEQRGIPYQSADYPTNGLNYMLFNFQYIIPYIFILGIVFVLTSLFTGSYVERIYRDGLLPRSKGNLMVSSVGAGTITAVAIFVFSLLFSLLLASVFYGFGELNYPVVSYNIDTQAIHFQNISNLYLPSIILELLAIVFIVLFVYLVSYLIRERLASVFVSLLSIIGLMLLVTVIEPIQKIAQFLPMTYFYSVSVASGQLAHSIDNYSVSFQNGLICLVLANVALTVLITFIQNHVKKY